MASQTKHPAEFEQNNAQVREVKTKLVRDYIDNQRQLAKASRQGNGAPNVVQVFSVFDDVKLHGTEALDKEFHTRQYDPYELYKQKLTTQPAQTRTLNFTVSESASMPDITDVPGPQDAGAAGSLPLSSQPKGLKQPRSRRGQPTSKLERKIVVNTGFLLDPSDSPKDVLRKLSACIADAGGLGVDFRGL